MEFLVGIRPIVPDRHSKESQKHASEQGNYLPLDPQPAVVDSHLAFVTAENAADAAELFIRSRGGLNVEYPVTVIVFGPGADLTIDLAAVAQDPAPAPA